MASAAQPSRVAPASPYAWAVVAMLWCVCVFNYADRQAIFSVFPLLKQEMGLSDVQLGVVGAAFMWVYALAGPFAGFVGDRVPRKTLILGGLAFWSLVTAGTALSTSYSHLVLCRALEGFGEAFYFPASMSLISDYHGPATRSRAMALHQSSVYVGTILGGTVAGVMGQQYGWRSSFWLFGGLGVVLAVALLGLLRDPGRTVMADVKSARADGVLATLRDIFRHPLVPVLIIVFLGANFVASIFLTWLPSFLGRKFGMSLAMAGFSGTAYLQASSVIGVLLGGLLADRWARRRAGGRPLTQALGLLAGVPFLFLTGWTLSVPVLVLSMSAFGLCKGLYDANIWPSLYDVVPASRRASALGLMNSVAWLGGGIAPVAIGHFSASFGLSACISATAAVYLAVGLLLLGGVFWFRRVPAPTQA